VFYLGECGDIITLFSVDVIIKKSRMFSSCSFFVNIDEWRPFIAYMTFLMAHQTNERKAAPTEDQDKKLPLTFHHFSKI